MLKEHNLKLKEAKKEQEKHHSDLLRQLRASFDTDIDNSKSDLKLQLLAAYHIKEARIDKDLANLHAGFISQQDAYERDKKAHCLLLKEA